MNPNPTPESIARAADAALFYRSHGWNALPSRSDRKGPAMATYADYWDRDLPDDTYRGWATPNVQVMTGARWRLCVVDCDGDEAHAAWGRMQAHYSQQPLGSWPTWAARTGGGGWHYWFRLPAWLDKCPSGRLWGLWDTFGPRHEGEWRKHQEVRLLADHALVIAPPSTHVETGREYRWVAGRGPSDFHAPAMAPDWLLGLPRIGSPSFGEKVTWQRCESQAPRPSVRPAGAFYTREDVLAAIPDKIALAQRWGLRFASTRENAKGWCTVHAVDREDHNPSASFSPASGVYTEQRDGARLSLFDLAVRLGQYPNWEDAKNALGDEFCPRVRTHAGKTPINAR